jgi:hypothetical protein
MEVALDGRTWNLTVYRAKAGNKVGVPSSSSWCIWSIWGI